MRSRCIESVSFPPRKIQTARSGIGHCQPFIVADLSVNE